MTFLYTVFAIALASLAVCGIAERRRHEANLEATGVRVLVNGIRGKSSITRLIAGALRGGGLRVVAKTTGSAARFIHPDGHEEPVHRKFGIANIAEHTDVIRRAASHTPDALVMECMAVQPHLQEFTQDIYVRSTIGVVCNVREDHLAEMGPTLQDVARSLSRTMPRGGFCVTAEDDPELLRVLAGEADRRECQLRSVVPEAVTDDEMERFSWFTFKENVAIALAVADRFGIGRQAAFEGMWAAAPDPGVLSVEVLHLDGRTMRFANLFAANDPQSTVANFRLLLDRDALTAPVIVLINCRPDRVERNAQMGQIVEDLMAEKIVAIGAPTRSALNAIPSSWSGSITDLGGLDRDGGELFRSLFAEIDGEASVVAVGNIHGQGEALLEHMERVGELR